MLGGIKVSNQSDLIFLHNFPCDFQVKKKNRTGSILLIASLSHLNHRKWKSATVYSIQYWASPSIIPYTQYMLNWYLLNECICCYWLNENSKIILLLSRFTLYKKFENTNKLLNKTYLLLWAWLFCWQ